jgi:DNA gyrase/topoisomerase IV subunit A
MTNNVENIDIHQQLTSLALNYAAEVIVARALPDLRDGLKPVGRRIIYSMDEKHLEPTKPFRKSSYVVGNVMADYHSHGDSSIYGALVLLAQPWSQNAVLVDGHGNFGSIEGLPNAAMRYTESRKSKYANLLIDNIKKNAVKMVPNFDGSTVEPEVLPAAFPLLLTNGTDGIAWGMSTNIIPHNAQELTKAAIESEKSGSLTTVQLAKIIKGPDLPTGCDVIVDKKELIKEIETGRARYIMRAEINVISDKKKPRLVIKSLPYKVKLDTTFFNKLVDVCDNAKIFNVIDIENSTKSENVHLEVICKPNTTEEKLNMLKTYLYKETALEKSFVVENRMIDKGHPNVIGISEYLKKFNAFRLETLKNMWLFDRQNVNDRLEIVNGLLRLEEIYDKSKNIILLHKIVDFARASKSKDELIKTLTNQLDFTARQAEHIAGLQIYQLGNINFDKLKDEKVAAEEKIAEFTLYLTNDSEASKKLIEDLENTLAKLKDLKRKSKIILPDNVVDTVPIKLDDLVESNKTKVIIKKDLQIFQIGRVAYNNQIEKYKDNDIVAAIDAMTTDYIMAITADGQAVTRFVNDLPSVALDGRVKRSNEEIPDLKANAEFVGGIVIDKNNKSDKFFMLSAEGKVKAGYFDKLIPTTTNKGYIKRLSKAMGLKTDTDRVVFVSQFNQDDFNNLEMHVELQDTSKKSGKVIRKVKLSKFKDREDTKNGAGTSGINTKKGTLPFISVKITEKV